MKDSNKCEILDDKTPDCQDLKPVIFNKETKKMNQRKEIISKLSKKTFTDKKTQELLDDDCDSSKLKNYPKEFGKQVQKYRIKLQMTQKQLAQHPKINISHKEIVNIENGTAKYNPVLCNKIKRVLEIKKKK